MVRYIDVHAHLDYPELYMKLGEVLERAAESEVLTVTAGVNPISNRTSLSIYERAMGHVLLCMGIYPPDALARETGSENKFDIDEEVDFIRQNKDKIVGIGEVGLDYYNGGQTDEAKEMQKDVFRKMIALSKEIDKPLVIHTRKAEADVVEILEESDLKPHRVVLHCFSGKKSLVKKCAEKGWHFTIPTNANRNGSFQSMIRRIPLSQLFCETDSPWLSPFGRMEQNEPKNVIESYKLIAELKEMDLNEVKNNIFMNWQRVFT